MGISILFISLASMGGVGLVLAGMLAVADKKLAVKEDPRVEKALEMLPGANCGACGFAGCAAYAAAVVEGKVSVDACKPGGAEVAKLLSELLGLEEAVSITPKVARVFCSGGIEETVKDKVYTGIQTCVSADIVGGEKGCMYSCIGFGDCCEVCQFDAIHMNDNGLPVVDLAKCTGCGECVRACPRNIIGLTDYDEVVHVYCRSRDKGAVTKKVCKTGCIACKLCEKDDDSGAVKVVDNLSVIDYGVNKAPVSAVKRCPTKVIRISKPVPGHEKPFEDKLKEQEKAVAEEKK
jgi:electron transport complex protein RnfB